MHISHKEKACCKLLYRETLHLKKRLIHKWGQTVSFCYKLLTDEKIPTDHSGSQRGTHSPPPHPSSQKWQLPRQHILWTNNVAYSHNTNKNTVCRLVTQHMSIHDNVLVLPSAVQDINVRVDICTWFPSFLQPHSHTLSLSQTQSLSSRLLYFSRMS